MIIESPTSLSLAPDGNGGIYNALKKTGAFHDICTRKIEYLHIYGIDNVLTKSLDPVCNTKAIIYLYLKSSEYSTIYY